MAAASSRGLPESFFVIDAHNETRQSEGQLPSEKDQYEQLKHSAAALPRPLNFGLICLYLGGPLFCCGYIDLIDSVRVQVAHKSCTHVRTRRWA